MEKLDGKQDSNVEALHGMRKPHVVTDLEKMECLLLPMLTDIVQKFSRPLRLIIVGYLPRGRESMLQTSKQIGRGTCDSPEQLARDVDIAGKFYMMRVERSLVEPFGFRWRDYGHYRGRHDIQSITYLSQADGTVLCASNPRTAPRIDVQYIFQSWRPSSSFVSKYGKYYFPGDGTCRQVAHAFVLWDDVDRMQPKLLERVRVNWTDAELSESVLSDAHWLRLAVVNDDLTTEWPFIIGFFCTLSDRVSPGMLATEVDCKTTEDLHLLERTLHTKRVVDSFYSLPFRLQVALVDWYNRGLCTPATPS